MRPPALAPTDSRGSERPRPGASRGRERRSTPGDADRLTLEGQREPMVIADQRPTGSRGGERPKASRGSQRREHIDAERLVVDDQQVLDADRRVLQERNKHSRGSDRPKASRSSKGRAPSDAHQFPTDPRGEALGERTKASRSSDRLKSRGGDRGPRGSTGEGDRNAERPGRYDIREGEILLNQDKPLTLEDWFANPGLSRIITSDNCLVCFQGPSCLCANTVIYFHVQPISFPTILGLLRVFHICQTMISCTCRRKGWECVCLWRVAPHAARPSECD